MDYAITEKELPPQLALTHRAQVTMETMGVRIGAAFGALVEHAARTGAQWAGPPFILYPEICEGEFEIGVCMPVVPGAEGGDQVALEEVPERLLVVGGGIIGLELASVFHALGSRVTVVELLEQLMTGADPDLVRPLRRIADERYERILLGS